MSEFWANIGMNLKAIQLLYLGIHLKGIEINSNALKQLSNFVGEMLEKYPDLRLVDYGFTYHLHPAFPQYDITWFLMQKA